MNLTPDVDKFIPYSTLEWMDRCQMWIISTLPCNLFDLVLTLPPGILETTCQ